jgi:6-pyruvoyltetrahydropterin/6-carboxytetrahydropterin synthase
LGNYVLFTINVETSFNASHQLTLADGSKEPLHNHDWVVCVSVSRKELNNIGIVMDFHKLKAMVRSIVADFDSANLDDFDYFEENNSSAESLARYIYEKLEHLLPDDVKLEGTTVVEEPGCSVKFQR